MIKIKMVLSLIMSLDKRYFHILLIRIRTLEFIETIDFILVLK
jgi:hypothetical protein